MRYWGILLGKLVAAAAVLYAVWYCLHLWRPEPAQHVRAFGHDPFVHDLGWTTIMFLYNLLVNGFLVLIILDQRYRCRTCGRRLRMPIRRGTHAQVLFGPPRTEYICIYGHGTLKVNELQLTGREAPDWKPHEDMWKELYSIEEEEKQK
ncbi:MAG: hypothetical protein HYZ57_09545 [Acidobacteria bacterium]|nr:hypothetical protein [Acidobacteriota bacterium]MBI3280071.1 hypothetical protein [Acidobacteriota bacterium]